MNDLASSNSKPASRVKPPPRAAPPPQQLGGSCESRSGFSGHGAALHNSPARAAAIPCPGQAGTGEQGLCWCQHPEPPAQQGRRWEHLCAAERGTCTLSHQLKQTFKHTTFCLRETIPLLFSTSALSLIVHKKLKSALHF